MNYDVHTHVGVDLGFYLRGWWPYASTTADLIALMDAHAVDRAVVFPFALPSAFDAEAFARDATISLTPGRVPFDRENLALAKEIERIDTGKRLIQFAMFDPSRETENQLAALRPLVGRIRGLKTQSTILRSPIRDLLGPGRAILELAEQHGLPVLVHTSVNDPWAQAADCLAVAAAFPRVRFNLAHSLRFHAPLLRQAAAMPNVWVDCSTHLAQCQFAREDSGAVAPRADRVAADYHHPTDVLRVIHEMLGTKYLWGSDNPFMSWFDDRTRIRHTYADERVAVNRLPANARRDMMSVGPQAWLEGVPASPPPGAEKGPHA